MTPQIEARLYVFVGDTYVCEAQNIALDHYGIFFDITQELLKSWMTLYNKIPSISTAWYL